MFEERSNNAADLGIAMAGPQPEYRISLTLSVADASALWTAAATCLLAAPGMTLDDAIDVIGPCQDPSILECLTAIACPAAMAGCQLDDFWVDGLKSRPPRLETLFDRPNDRSAISEKPMRRLPMVSKRPTTLHVSR